MRQHLPRTAATLIATCSLAACSAAWGQPTEYFDIGPVNPPAAPATAREYLPLTNFDLFDFFEGDVLTVEWMRFDVQTPVVPPLYLDVDTRLYQLENLPVGLTLALYDASGNLVAVDDRDGSFPEGFGAAGLSFGSTDYRVPPDLYVNRGQDGTLAAGTYWLALSAGSLLLTQAGPTGWDVTTDAAYSMGFFDPGTYYLDISMLAGNTTPVPPPPNDLCQNALVVGENPDPFTPVWTGTNAGALNDGQFPCYRNNTPPFDTKDVWFSYVPSRTGYAVITATGGSGGATPMIDRYDASQGCGSPSVQCSGGGSITFGEGARMFVPVTQGEPVLLALGIRAGYVDDMQLNIDLVPLPCELSVPAGAVLESESSCGQDLNGGCNMPTPTFDSIDLGLPVRGTLFTTPILRDTDWFTFTVDEASSATITSSAQVPLFIVAWPQSESPDECFAPPVLFSEDLNYSVICEERTLLVDLDPGTYVLAIGATFFDNLPCGSGYGDYWIRVDAESLPDTCPSCAADFNQDGGVDGGDIESFFVSWQDGEPCGDVNLDGGVDGGDVESFIVLWEAGGC
ncbi:MAG: hypothetical protein RL689_1730 [Planctomycetota bacterium]|jgi:hypothetical protein